MKPYMIIEGNHSAIEAFEKKVADALEMGYSLAGELVTQPHATEIKFYQPVILADDQEDEEEDEDWDEEEEDEDDE